MTQNTVKSSNVEPVSVNKDMVMAENTGSEIPKIDQPIASGDTGKKDSVKVCLS